MFTKISNRIIVSFVALIVALIALLMFLIINNVREYHFNILKREIIEKLNFVELEIRRDRGKYLRGAIPEREAHVRELSRIINLRITLVDFNGMVIADSDYVRINTMDNHKYRIEINQALKTGAGESIRYSNTLQTDLLYLAKKSDSEIIRLAKPLQEIDESIAILWKYILTAGLITMILSGATVVLITRRITGPINETMSFARDFSEGDFSRRILDYSNDEIGTLQKTLNRLADTAQEKINSLLEEQHKLEITIESIHDGIAVIGRDKRVVIANRAFSAILDVNTAAVGKLFFEAIRDRALNSRIEQVNSTGASASFEEELVNGKLCEIVINPIRGEKTLQGMLLVLRDITEKKKIEKMKTDLVGNMSHELKTPIAILKGYLETLEQYLGDPEMSRDLLRKAIENVDRQTALVNDILKLNLLETSADFAMETIEVTDTVRSCVDILSVKAQKKNIGIRLNTFGLTRKVAGNKFLAEEIFFNIIDNAINYNQDRGLIEIEAKIDGGRMSVSIKDTGIGIPPDSIDRIFERFYRVDKSRSRATGGTGLGLSIVKHAAELLGWNISVSSGSNGTIFVVEI